MKKIVLISLIMFSLLFRSSWAQLDVVGDFFAGGNEDAIVLLENYLEPWANALGANLSSGWYNSAKPHKLGGFDLTFLVTTTQIPDEALTFNVNELPLQNIVNEPGLTPTVAGDRSGGVQLEIAPDPENNPNIKFPINLPGGTGLKYMPTPIIQAGIGLVKSTDITIRYLPELNIGSYGKLGLWGIGLKHDIKQWIPGLKKMPAFQMSVQGGYTSFSSSANIDITPSTYGISYSGPDIYNTQSLDFGVTSFTANLLVGANLPLICVYGGVGFAKTSAEIVIDGIIPIPAIDAESASLTVKDIENLDPIEMDNFEGSKTKPRLNAGVRLKLGVITIHADYTYANYSVVAAGLGISFR